MIITLKTTATEAEVTKLRNELEAKGLVIHPVSPRIETNRVEARNIR